MVVMLEADDVLRLMNNTWTSITRWEQAYLQVTGGEQLPQGGRGDKAVEKQVAGSLKTNEPPPTEKR